MGSGCRFHEERQRHEKTASSEELVGDVRLRSLPSASYKAISVTWKVRKPKDIRMVRKVAGFVETVFGPR